MSLTLNAEQKHISKIFYDKTKYVIPAYQRPYSWTKNECKELFEDLKIAYYENKKEEYFLGSLILVFRPRRTGSMRKYIGRYTPNIR